MESFGEILARATGLILSADPGLRAIIALSLRVTLAAVALAAVLGFPLGAALGAFRFPGRAVLSLTVTALMGLPPVVVGLLVYMMFSAAGPFGALGLLYTPFVMVIAQMILVTPIIAALTQRCIEELNREYAEHFASLGVGPFARVCALLWDARYSLLTVALAGFGRAVAEVGAVIIVGGNIDHVTRVMTTAIALETSRGNLELALALGMILLVMALVINGVVMSVRALAERLSYV